MALELPRAREREGAAGDVSAGQLLTAHPFSRPPQVLPLYGNTHTTTSVTGLQSTCFRLEARQMVAQACNARIRCCWPEV